MTPTLTIQTSARGIDRIIVHVGDQNKKDGFIFLEKLLPVLGDLDKKSRDQTAPQKVQGKR